VFGLFYLHADFVAQSLFLSFPPRTQLCRPTATPAPTATTAPTSPPTGTGEAQTQADGGYGGAPVLPIVGGVAAAALVAAAFLVLRSRRKKDELDFVQRSLEDLEGVGPAVRSSSVKRSRVSEARSASKSAHRSKSARSARSASRSVKLVVTEDGGFELEEVEAGGGGSSSSGSDSLDTVADALDRKSDSSESDM
jgi:hypothetical protein